MTEHQKALNNIDELFRKNIDNQAAFNFDWDFQKGFYFFTVQNSSNVLLVEKIIVD